MTGAPAHPGLMSIRRVLDAPGGGEGCQLCGAALGPGHHRHVVNIDTGDLQCACLPCHLLFTAAGSGGGRWRAVPDRWLALTGEAAVWERLDVPVGVVFFVVESSGETARAHYPGPAGVVESSLPLAGWAGITADHPAVASLEPDVEAVLVRRDGASTEAYIVPIDACYELAGRLRGRWQGLGRGPGGHAEVDAFFAEVQTRATGERPS